MCRDATQQQRRHLTVGQFIRYVQQSAGGKVAKARITAHGWPRVSDALPGLERIDRRADRLDNTHSLHAKRGGQRRQGIHASPVIDIHEIDADRGVPYTHFVRTRSRQHGRAQHKLRSVSRAIDHDLVCFGAVSLKKEMGVHMHLLPGGIARQNAPGETFPPFLFASIRCAKTHRPYRHGPTTPSVG
jgi:hypothetical protein